MPRTRAEDIGRSKNVFGRILNGKGVNGPLFWQRNAGRGVSS